MAAVVTPEEARALPVAVDVTTAARLVGVSRNSAYLMIDAGTWPTTVVRFGRRIRIPTQPLLEFLGLGAASKTDVSAGGERG